MKWIGTGIAIAAAIIITGSTGALWFLLIPAMVDFSGKKEG